MEPIQHIHHQPRKKNSAKVNLTISIVFHALLVAAGAYWAAHEGVLGKRLQELSVLLVPKEKKEEAKKETKTEEVKKVEQPKATETAKAAIAAPKIVAPPPPADIAPAAPPAAELPSFSFSDGAKDVMTSDNPVVLYKFQVESALRSKWERPSDVNDSKYVAEVEMTVDPTGKFVGYDWKKGSGDHRWDDSVKKVLASTKGLSRPPPKGFPSKFVIRFDVESMSTEPVLSASAR
jgi:hypothetical protein